MTLSGETSGGHEQQRLEQQVIDIFVQARQKTHEVYQAMEGGSSQRQGLEELTGAVSKLSQEDILLLLKGESPNSAEALAAIDASNRYAENLRQGEFSKRLLWAYWKLQSAQAARLLEGRKISA